MSVTSEYTAEQLAAFAENWAPESRAAMIDYWRKAEQREQIRNRYADVAELASAVDPNFVITPALKLIASKIEVVLRQPRRNLLVTMPPYEGKSTLCAVYAPLRAFQLNPNTKTILATYAESLAIGHSRMCRDVVARHGSGVRDGMTGVEVEDKLGFQVSSSASKVDAWQIAGARGGLTAVGLHGTITGRHADLFIIDDPYKDMVEADSPASRAKVTSWMAAVARTRLSPNASIILIQTRWHPEDLAGEVIAKERKLPARYRTWHHINIPAVSEAGIPDALGREPGVWMDSALKRNAADFEATRREVGDRVWYALYQGSPRNPAGGLFMRSWFELHGEVPEHPVAAVVGIDPADTGKGDATGIIGGYLCPDGTVLLAEDWSGMYTSDQWARQAVILALTIGAREIAMEAYTASTTYAAVLKRAWRDIHKEALDGWTLGEAVTLRARSEQMPFTIFKWRGQANADSVARSSLLRQALETGKARTVATKLAVFEDQAADWQAGQHQPDRIAAGVIAHDRLVAMGSGRLVAASPLTGSKAVPPEWMRRKLTR